MRLRANIDGQFLEDLLNIIHHKMENGENSDGGKTVESLTAWLKKFGLSQDSIKNIYTQDLKIDDFKKNMTRDDLKSLKLPLGQELRIWADICRFRTNHLF